MCGISTTFWVALITTVIIGLVVFKLRSWFKHGKPLLEKLRDRGHDFTLFVVICLAMLFGAVGVAQTVGENSDKIAAFFAAVRARCEPPKDERTVDEYIEQELEKLRPKP